MLQESDYKNIPAENWNTSHVCAWLNSFGMGRYTEIFLANEINGPLLLSSVDEQALAEELGISSRMHRNGIIAQIGKLKSADRTNEQLRVQRDLLEIERQRAIVKKEEEEHKLKIEEHKLKIKRDEEEHKLKIKRDEEEHKLKIKREENKMKKEEADHKQKLKREEEDEKLARELERISINEEKMKFMGITPSYRKGKSSQAKGEREPPVRKQEVAPKMYTQSPYQKRPTPPKVKVNKA